MGFRSGIFAVGMETVSYLGCCFILYLLYEVLAVLYRLFLSPIAKFPGSKLTAATSWVETYYDVFKGGQFTHQIEIWHRQYGALECNLFPKTEVRGLTHETAGPIIRISPTEIHVADPDFYDVAYASSAPFDKIPRWRDRFGLPTAVQSTVHHDLHRSRRTALNPFFSKKQINAFSPYIQQCADKVCDRLLHEYRGTDKVLSMTDVYATFATDIIFYYTFAWNYDFMSFPNFIAPFTESIKELALSIHVAGHFPWFLALLQSAPDSVVSVLNPAMRPVFRFQNVSKKLPSKHVENPCLTRKSQEVKNQVIQIKEGKNEAYKSVEHKTVFSDLLASDLPPQEKSVTRLQQEAAGIVGAAIETTKTTLTLATFYVLNDSTILKNLKEELERAIPDLSKLPTLAELEQLPYLTAVIQEGT